MKIFLLLILIVSCSKDLELDGYLCPVRLTEDIDFRKTRSFELQLLEDCDDFKKDEMLSVNVSRLSSKFVSVNVKDYKVRVVSPRSLSYKIPILSKQGEVYQSKLEDSFSSKVLGEFLYDHSDVSSNFNKFPKGNYRFLPKNTPLVLKSYTR